MDCTGRSVFVLYLAVEDPPVSLTGGEVFIFYPLVRLGADSYDRERRFL